MRESLTDRQQQILDSIVSYRQRHGCSPSVKEIGEAMGISSTNGVAKQLKAMERKGAIRMTPNRARSIQVLRGDEPPEPPAHLPFISSFTGVSRRTLRQAASSSIQLDRSLLGRAEPASCFIGAVGDDGMNGQGIRQGDLVVVEERPLSRIAPQSLTACLLENRLIVRRMLRLNDIVHLVPEHGSYRTELVGDSSRTEVLGVVRTVIRPIR